MKTKPIIELPSGEKLNKSQFVEYFERKVNKTIRQYDLLDKQEHVGIALSGGKDSIVLLHLMQKIAQQNPKITIEAITIDEGIHSYRDKTIVTAKQFCEKNNIPLHIFSYKSEFGMPLDSMLKILDVKPCSICGVFRRYLLNTKSKQLGFTRLATGHNVDDEAQSILMNQFKNNMKSSARLGPKVGFKENKLFVQRIKPLYLCTEKEIAIYAFVNKLLDDFTECPNVAKSYRAQVRDMLNNFEFQNPGTKYAIVNSFLQVLPDLKQQFKTDQFSFCKSCGEPAARDMCNACKFVKKLEKAQNKVPIIK